MSKRFPLAICLTAVMVICPAWADFDQGLAAYRAKDFATAFAEFEQAARSGHDTSQFNLGVMYFRGEGVAKDLIRAYSWIELSTEHGDKDYIAAEEVLIMMLTSEQIRDGKALAIELAEEHGLDYTPLDIDDAQSRLTVVDRNR